MDSEAVALFTKVAVILAGAMWLGICAGLAVGAQPTPPRCYDTIPATSDGPASQTSPSACVDYSTPAIYLLAAPGLVTLIVGLVLPTGPKWEPTSSLPRW